MEVLIVIGLYLLCAVIIYFTLYILACREYKKKNPLQSFDCWYELKYGEYILYIVVWPIFLIAIVFLSVIKTIEKYIKKKFNLG